MNIPFDAILEFIRELVAIFENCDPARRDRLMSGRGPFARRQRAKAADQALAYISKEDCCLICENCECCYDIADFVRYGISQEELGWYQRAAGQTGE